MLHGVLRLNVIGSFTREKLEELVALDDKIARAWRADKYSTTSNWAEEIAKQVGCDPQTVYNRRKAWLAEYGVDIDLPYGFYRDLTVLAPTSLTTPENRSVLMKAMSRGDAEKTLALLAGAAKDFDRQRLEIVGSAIKGPLGQIPIETLVADTKAAAIKARAVALLASAKKPVRATPANPSLPMRVSRTKPASAIKKSRRNGPAKKPVRGGPPQKPLRPTRVGAVKKTARRVTPVKSTQRPSAAPKHSFAGRAGEKKRGPLASTWQSITVLGTTTVVPNKIDVLEKVLTAFRGRYQGFLARFARELGRIRPYVARTPEALYPGSPHLASQARHIGGGWWMPTNCSEGNIITAVRKACEIARVKYGTDVVIAFSKKVAARGA